MRILQVNSARYFGGGERHVVDLARALDARGQDVFLAISAASPVRSELSFLPDERVFEFPFKGSNDVGTSTALAKLAEEKHIDLIHAHVARDYPITALASRLSRIPFVITRHVLFPMSRLNRFLLRGVRFVMAPSNAVAASLHAQGIFSADKIVTVRHGLAPHKQLSRTARTTNEFVVGSVGNLDPVKGFDVLIRAARIVLAHLPNVRFEIAGDDRRADRRNESALRSLISELDLEARVSLRGWVSDIYQTIDGYDLFVSASRSESFGYALADAMLAGVAVVATDTEGAREVVGDTGQLVPIGSAEALAERIVIMLSDPERLAEARESGRKHIEEHFSLDRMVEETEDVYRRAVANR